MELRQKAVSGGKWLGFASISSTIIQLGAISILARLLSPTDFGLMGMILVVIGLAQTFQDAGISNVVIYKQDVTHEQLSTVFWLNILVGALTFLVILAINPLVVAYYKEPRLTGYLNLTALSFLITPFGQLYFVLFQKELQFKTLAIVEFLQGVFGAITSVVLAFLGFGIMSLVVGQLVRALSFSLLLFLAARKTWAPRFYFKLSEIKDLIKWGSYQIGERSINYFRQNVDYLLIGRFLGAELLGYYTLAYQLMIRPLQKINPIITKVALPVFSKIQDDDEQLRKWYLKIIKLIASVSIPIYFGVFVMADQLILLLYGPNWMPCVPVLQILCILGILYSLGNPIGCLLNCKGRFDIGFKWNIFAAIMILIADYIGVHWGIVGVATATATVTLFVFFPCGFYLRWLVVKMRVTPYLSTFKTPLFISAVMATMVYLAKTYSALSHVFLPMFVVLGVCIYAVLYYKIDSEFLFELKGLIFAKKGN